MKRITWTACILYTLCVLPCIAQESRSWMEELKNRNKGLIDSVMVYPQDKKAAEYTTLIIYYHQPLAHANPQGPQFPMRALFTYDNRKDPVDAVNHVYFTGYNLDSGMLTDPDSTFKDAYDDDMGEIAYRYRGNHIQLEHRYFDYSAPYECWKMLDYCTAEEAAEDFHAIIGALKKVFTGKWVISGVSKGGITTALQYLYHPEDADIFMPYAAPFYDTDRDSLTLHYWFNNGWNKNFLDRFMNVRRQAVSDKAHIYPIYEKMAAGNDDSPGHLDSVYGSYMSAIAQFGYQEHTYGDTVSIRKQIYRNDSILRRYNKQYEDTVYAYMIAASTYSLDMFQPWLDTLRVYSDRKQGPRRVAQMQHYAPFGVTEKDWANDDGSVSTAAYYYQAQCELGYYDCRFEEIAADEQTGAEWNRYWKEHFGCLLNFISPYFRSRTFSPSLYNRMMDAAKNATKPLIFLYGLDDTWTGAAIKDDFLNGTYSRKFILPAQNHNVCVSSNTDPAQCAEIKRIMDEVLGAPQGIEQTAVKPETGKARKFLKDGQVLVERNGRTYTITGQEVFVR